MRQKVGFIFLHTPIKRGAYHRERSQNSQERRRQRVAVLSVQLPWGYVYTSIQHSEIHKISDTRQPMPEGHRLSGYKLVGANQCCKKFFVCRQIQGVIRHAANNRKQGQERQRVL